MATLSVDLASTAGQLSTLGARVSACRGTARAVTTPLGTTAESLAKVWQGPLATTMTTATSTYALQVSPLDAQLASFELLCTNWGRTATLLAQDASRYEVTVANLGDQIARSVGGTTADQGEDLKPSLRVAEAGVETVRAEWRRVCSTHLQDIGAINAALAVIADAVLQSLPVPTGKSMQYALLLGWASSTAIRTMSTYRDDPAGAAAWWASLTEDQRRALVATRPDLFTFATFAPLASTWKAGLDDVGLHDLYSERAMFKAGIDPYGWDPSLGLTGNRDTVQAVYQYYTDLYSSKPGTFWWAGMAAMIGASFYGGFEDLSDIEGMTRAIKQLAQAGSKIPGFPGDISKLAGMSASELADQLHFFQTKLLSMQREIFLDMATAHEAYLDGGVPTIERLYANDAGYNFGPQTIVAWKQIDEGTRTGNQSLIEQGNGTLLYREQYSVIRDDYNEMYNHPVTGPAMTYLMTLSGAPSIPNAKTFAQVFPIKLGVGASAGTPRSIFGIPLPHASCEADVSLATPLPAVNVANFDSRWALIEKDTLPKWVDLAKNHPDKVAAILADPVATRANDYRIIHRVDDIVTSWDVQTNAGCSVGFG